ncbi:MAG: type II secretion system protein J [Oscillospiraceae bacterium]
MIKKLRSKRGFTLVEVMVAFVIFAIMAAMVSAILQQTLLAKQENTDLQAEIANQENVYYRSKQVKTGEYDASDRHTVTLDFVDKNGASIQTIPLDYSIGDPNPDDADNQITLNYIQGDLDYKTEPNAAPGNDKPSNSGDEGGSVHSRLISNIYGSSDISNISMYMVKAPDDESNGKNRYYVSLQVNASALMSDFYKSFAKINFDLPSGITVVGCGKITSKKTASTEKPYDFSLLTSPKAGYEVTTPTKGTFRIASTVHKDDGSGCILAPGFGEFGVYLDLSSPLDSYMNNDTANSVDLNKLFGYSDDLKTSNKNTSNYYVFKPYQGKTYDSEGNVLDENGIYPNVFAGSQK